MNEGFRRLQDTLRESIKWGLIIWFIIPVLNSRHSLTDAIRMVTGSAMVIIFTGKRFYDSIFDRTRKSKENWWVDSLLLLGMIGSFTLLIFAVMIAITSLVSEVSDQNFTE